MYSWRQVAERTEKVYDFAMNRETPNILDKLKTAYTWGPVAGIYAILFHIMELMIIFLTETFWPEEDIDIIRSFNSEMYSEDMHKFGEHHFYVDSKDPRNLLKPQETIIIDRSYSVETHRISTVNHKRRFETLN